MLRVGLLVLLLAGCRAERRFRAGDLVFQQGQSPADTVVRLATRSAWTQVGLLVGRPGRFYVLAATDTVRLTPLHTWIARGGGHYEVKRLAAADSLLSPRVQQRLDSLAQCLLRRPGDPYFGWDDERLYGAELVFKLYREAAGVQVGRLQELSTLDLAQPKVAALLHAHYGTELPGQALVVTPGSMYQARNLVLVHAE